MTRHGQGGSASIHAPNSATPVASTLWLAIGGICSFSVGSRRFARTNAALAALSPPTMFLSGAVPPAGTQREAVQ